MLHAVIRTHTREAGVRELDRKLATICRKSARKVVQGRTTRVRITPHNLEEYLGPARYRTEAENRHDQVGVATGLAWTEHGGELLPVEVATMPGRGGLTITGRLGDVMKESASAALSYARSRAKSLNIDLEALERTDLHIHLPEGAIPKDGPSAGITMATALISAITERPVRSDLGMTGEITLTGRVLAIGGLKEKVLAAHRSGIRYMIAPLANKPDWAELPRAVRRDIQFDWVESMDQVIKLALLPAESQPAVPVAVVDSAVDQAEGELDSDAITEPGEELSTDLVPGAEGASASEQSSAVVLPRTPQKGPAAASPRESRRGGSRRSRKIPSAEAPSANLMPQEDILNFEF
jgi:ATP-dependent Lon protease